MGSLIGDQGGDVASAPPYDMGTKHKRSLSYKEYSKVGAIEVEATEV